MNDPKRQEIQNRIAAAQARNEQRGTTFMQDVGEIAGDTRDKFTHFAREHPLAVVAGGLVAGVLISALFKGSPTRKLGKKTAGLAAIGVEMALGYAQRAMEAAEVARRAGTEKLDDLGDSIGDRARTARRDAVYRASGASDNARIIVRKAGKRLSRAMKERLN